MKRILRYSVLLFVICCSVKKTVAQSSCTQYVIDSFRVFQNKSTGYDSIYLVYYDPSSGAKSTQITAKCGATTVFQQCYNTQLSNKAGTVAITTGSFYCPNIANLTVIVAAYTGNTTCLGTPCYTLLSAGGGPLPVYFENFTAARQGSSVSLQWTTASEENNKGFEVERKIGMGDWTPVAFVSSQAPGGTSISNLNYSFADDDNTNEATLYRLRQVDLDGKFAYSRVRSVQGVRSNGLNVTIFPNPSRNGQTTVSFTDITQSYSLTLVDANGRVLKQWGNVQGSSFNLTGLMPGWYNLLILAKESGKQTVEKFIVTR